MVNTGTGMDTVGNVTRGLGNTEDGTRLCTARSGGISIRASYLRN